MNRRTTLRLLALAIALGFVIPAAGRFSEPAHASFPGLEGKIAYAYPGSFDIETVSSNQTLAALTSYSSYNDEPAWSPDGKKLAFVSNRLGLGQNDIYTMKRDGTGVKRLTTSVARDGSPTWSPDGKYIVFTSDRAPGNRDIYRMRADGIGAERRLTTSPGADDNPNWGTNGRIAYDNDADGDQEIFAMNPDGTEIQKLTDNVSDDNMPNWSPDSSRIAFSSDAATLGNMDIYTMRADSGDWIRLTDDPALDTLPVWAPSALRIAWVTTRTGHPRLFATDSATGAAEEMLVDRDATNPDWQPIRVKFARVSQVEIDAHGTFATVSWRQTFATTKARIELWQGKKGNAGSKVKLQTKTALNRDGSAAPARKVWQIKITHLRPGTTYELYIVPGTGDTVPIKQAGGLKTLRRKVDVTFTRVKVFDDGDATNCGDFHFAFLVDDVYAGTSNSTTETICDGETWIPSGLKVTSTNVKDATIMVKALAVDNDTFDPCPPFCTLPTTGIGYGLMRDAGEWAEKVKEIDVSAKSFTAAGEQYTKNDQTLYLVGCGGCPRLEWSFNYSVAHTG